MITLTIEHQPDIQRWCLTIANTLAKDFVIWYSPHGSMYLMKKAERYCRTPIEWQQTKVGKNMGYSARVRVKTNA